MNLFDLMATLGLDSSEYEKGLDDSERKASSFGDKLKAGLGAAAKFTAGAVGAASAGVVALTKSAVDSYADYEQLVGGVETLFGDSAEKVVQNASNAFNTAGMSMNDYMETSIQSAAALINSLEGDQSKAADLMNMSIVDMSDNVNKMGTSMEAVQNAYRGFSRGNFTMLDNLALGFAGTKEGMQQLLDTAGEISGIEYDISSYSDIVQAIHVVQEEMGVAGTTAKEASGTISGSLSALKSGWSNLVTAIATDNGDIEGSVDSLASGVETVLDNLIPTIGRAINGIGTVIGRLAPVIVSKIPDIVRTVFPVLMTAVGEMIAAFTSSLPEIISIFADLIPQLTQSIINSLPSIMATGTQILQALINGITVMMPQLISQVPLLIQTLVLGITEGLPTLLESGGQMLQAIISGIISTIPALVEMLPTIIQAVADAVTEGLPLILEQGVNILLTIINGLTEAIPKLVEYIPQIIDTIVNVLSNNLPLILQSGVQILIMLIQGLAQAIPQLIKMLPQIITTIVSTLRQNLPQILQAGATILKNLVSGIVSVLGELGRAAGRIFTTVWDVIKGIPAKMLEIGGNIVSGIWNGISNGFGWIKDKISGWVGNVVGFIKGLFGIHSPSTVFRDEVGKMLGLGFAQGIEDSTDDAVNSAAEMAKSVLDTMDGMDTAFSAGVSGLPYQGVSANALTAGGSGVTINVYGAVGQDVSELAEIVSQKIAFATQQEKVAWA